MRLVTIDRRIHRNEYPTCTSLAREFEVSERTISRDIQYLRDFFDAPIDYDSANHGFFYTEPNFSLPALSLRESDLFAICIAEKALAQYENTPLYARLSAVFDKLSALLPNEVKAPAIWIDTPYTFIQESHTIIDSSVWDTISQGLRDQQSIKINHRKAGNSEALSRIVDPYHFVSYRGEWYLVGFCHHRHEIVRFAMSRIDQAQLTGLQFRSPENFNINMFMGTSFGIMSGEKEYRIKLRFSQAQSPYAAERIWQEGQIIEEVDNGMVELSFVTSSLFEVKRWILSWGADVQVLEPPELIKEVHDEAEAMVKLYLNNSITL